VVLLALLLPHKVAPAVPIAPRALIPTIVFGAKEMLHFVSTGTGTQILRKKGVATGDGDNAL